MHIIHKWSKWKLTNIGMSPGPLAKKLDPKAKDFEVAAQFRKCLKCNKVQVRTLTY